MRIVWKWIGLHDRSLIVAYLSVFIKFIFVLRIHLKLIFMYL